MSLSIKVIVIRILIIVIPVMAILYEPGLTVFAIAGAVAAWFLLRDAGKAKIAKDKAPPV